MAVRSRGQPRLRHAKRIKTKSFLQKRTTNPTASAAYDQGYSHMREAAWFAAIAAYDEAIRIQPDVAGLYESRGTAYVYAGRLDDALADYSHAIELNPTDPGLWRQRAQAHTIAPTPEWEKARADIDRTGSAGKYQRATAQHFQRHCLDRG